LVRLGKVSIAVKTFGACDFSRLAATDWRLRRWRLWFFVLMTATRVTRRSSLLLSAYAMQKAVAVVKIHQLKTFFFLLRSKYGVLRRLGVCRLGEGWGGGNKPAAGDKRGKLGLTEEWPKFM